MEKSPEGEETVRGPGIEVGNGEGRGGVSNTTGGKGFSDP